MKTCVNRINCILKGVMSRVTMLWEELLEGKMSSNKAAIKVLALARFSSACSAREDSVPKPR